MLSKSFRPLIISYLMLTLFSGLFFGSIILSIRIHFQRLDYAIFQDSNSNSSCIISQHLEGGSVYEIEFTIQQDRLGSAAVKGNWLIYGNGTLFHNNTIENIESIRDARRIVRAISTDSYILKIQNDTEITLILELEYGDIWMVYIFKNLPPEFNLNSIYLTVFAVLGFIGSCVVLCIGTFRKRDL